jgi:hypothetical protein
LPAARISGKFAALLQSSLNIFLAENQKSRYDVGAMSDRLSPLTSAHITLCISASEGSRIFV